jgi:hypothetical protein
MWWSVIGCREPPQKSKLAEARVEQAKHSPPGMGHSSKARLSGQFSCTPSWFICIKSCKCFSYFRTAARSSFPIFVTFLFS